MKSYQKCLCTYISVLQSWTGTTTVKPENVPHAAFGFTSQSLFNGASFPALILRGGFAEVGQLFFRIP